MVIPAKRFYEVSEVMKNLNFGMRRLQFVIPKEGTEAHLCLIDAERFYNGPHDPIPTLTIHQQDGRLTQEVDLILTGGLQRE